MIHSQEVGLRPDRYAIGFVSTIFGFQRARRSIKIDAPPYYRARCAFMRTKAQRIALLKRKRGNIFYFSILRAALWRARTRSARVTFDVPRCKRRRLTRRASPAITCRDGQRDTSHSSRRHRAGVLGSGQLGRMFAIAARRMGYRVHTFSPDTDTPTGQVADLEIVAAYEDLDSVRKFARGVSVVTFDFENVPAPTAAAAAEFARVRPAGSVLHTTQNRLREKNFLAKHGFPVTPFRAVRSADDFDRAKRDLGAAAILKTADFGYDGKGQIRVNAETKWTGKANTDYVYEAFVDFDREVSVVAARGSDGSFAHWGVIENRHEDGILNLSIAPADVSAKIQTKAIEITRAVLESLDVVGVLCVEFFVTPLRRVADQRTRPAAAQFGASHL